MAPFSIGILSDPIEKFDTTSCATNPSPSFNIRLHTQVFPSTADIASTDMSQPDISSKKTKGQPVFEPIKTSTYFLVLLVLRDGPRHGYEIAASIKDRSQGYFSISFGSLYPVLHKLEKDNLVEAQWQEAGDVKSKKVYQLTDKGSRQMRAELEQFHSIMKAFKDFIGEG